jgi:L-ascorbate metabolism protein UlaG (beta-lactamase superfamily)
VEWVVSLVIEVIEIVVCVVFRVIRFFSLILTGLFGVSCRSVSEGEGEYAGRGDYADGRESWAPLGIPLRIGPEETAIAFAPRSHTIHGAPHCLRVQYLGTNSIHISDGITHLLIDPYFTRANVPKARLLLCEQTMLAPEQEIIERTLREADITSLDAILMTHAHYDHALDIAQVSNTIADWNGGQHPTLVGSESIYQIGVGGGLPPESIETVNRFSPEGRRYAFGGFEVTFIRNRHIHVFGLGGVLDGSITGRLVPPMSLARYKEGITYAIYIRHSLGNILNLGSANFCPGAFDGLDVDYLVLGVAGLDVVHLDNLYRRDLYRAVVEATSPERVLFSHWDDFNLRLDQRPRWFYDPPATQRFFRAMNPDLDGEFMPIWGYIVLRDSEGPY